MSSSLLTLSVQPSTNNNVLNNNNLNINNSIITTTTLSPLPSSTSTSPCITPQPHLLPQQQSQQQQMPVICKKLPLPSISMARNGRKRPAINLPPLHLQPALEHRRRENDARLRDTKAQIEASFLSETPSSPGGYSNSSTDSQPSGSDDDSQNSISALCSSAQYEKRIKFDSTIPSIYNNSSQSVSVDTLDSELLSGASSTKTSGIHETPPDILGADEYMVIMSGGEEFQVLEKSTNNLFQAIKMDAQKYKKFMKVAARIESARKFFHPQEFRRLKSRIIPSDTRIVHGSRGISYLLMPSHHASLSLKVKDRPKNGVLSEKEVQTIVFQIVEMMELCHQVGLFFGDFKYDKFVFVDSQKTQIRPRSPLIFHLSNDSNNDTLFGTKVGWAFMAPEMLNRRQTSYSGSAADMWALGVLAFTLLAGNYPFIGNEPQALFTRIRSRSITAKSDKEFVASPEARIMVYSLLCKNPSDRPSAERLKQCHWLKMSPEEFTISFGNSLSSDCGRSSNSNNNNLNSNQPIPLTQFLHQQLEQAQQRYFQARNGLSRVNSDRRLNRAMEHRLAMYRAQSSDQVVPATANVLFPTANNVSQRICVFSSADSRRQ
jgi:serine/threonine protein kinase